MSALKQANNSELQTYQADEIVLFPGESSQLYKLRKGLIRIHTVDNEGKGLTLRYIKPGGFLGEEVLIHSPRRYFAEAITFCELEIIRADRLSAKETQDLVRNLAQAVEGLYRSLYRLSGKRLKSRIAAELLELQDSALATLNAEGKPTIHMTHDELAAAVGSVRETVTKVVGELSKEGAISAGYGKLILLDLPSLHHIADE